MYVYSYDVLYLYNIDQKLMIIMVSCITAHKYDLNPKNCISMIFIYFVTTYKKGKAHTHTCFFFPYAYMLQTCNLIKT